VEHLVEDQDLGAQTFAAVAAAERDRAVAGKIFVPVIESGRITQWRLWFSDALSRIKLGVTCSHLTLADL
jgi:hypothetical protein